MYEIFAGVDNGWVEPLVEEALRAKAARKSKGAIELRHMGPKALVRRRWERTAEGGERRLEGHEGVVCSMSLREGRVYITSLDGTIRVWNQTTLEHERTLVVDSERDSERRRWACLLPVWEGFLISGDSDGFMVLWNVATGEREWELEGHELGVYALAVSGSLLLSGSGDAATDPSRCGRWELRGHGRAQGRWRVMAMSARWRRGRARW